MPPLQIIRGLLLTALTCLSLVAATDVDKAQVLKEAAVMSQFSHPNILPLVGVCVNPASESILVVFDYMQLGSLQGYLQSSVARDKLEPSTMLRFALDVCSAMQYLAEAGFVVRLVGYLISNSGGL